MVDPRQQSAGNSAVLWLSLILFVLFFLQVGFQKYHAMQARLRLDPRLSSELADAAILEDDPPADPSDGWPQWRGPRRDGVTHEPNLLMQWPASGPPRLWRADASEGFSSFAVKDGRAFTLLSQGGKEAVMCWDAAGGKELWCYSYESPPIRQFPGPRATPTLDGDRLYTLGSGGLLLCLDAARGTEHWRHDLLSEFHAPRAEWGAAASPLVDGDLVFANPGGQGGNSLVAFHKTTGELVWKALDDPAGYSSPIAITVAGVRQVVFFTGHSVVGVTAADGKLCWRFAWPTEFKVNAATPVYFRARKGDRVLDYVFISSGYDRGCALLKIAADGAGGFTAEPVYQGNQMRSHFASPVRYRDHLYGFDETKLTCLDLRTGKVVWSQSGFHKGSLLRVDDHLLVLGENGNLALVDATPDGYREKATAHPFRRRCWTMPVLADGRLYLRDEQQVLCLDLRRQK